MIKRTRSTRTEAKNKKATQTRRRPAGARDKILKGAAVRQAMLDAAERLLQQHTPSTITTTMILAEADVARGTLYHHFDSAGHLLESAMISIFSRHVTANILMLESVINESRNHDEFLAGLKHVTHISQSADRRPSRFARARLIVAAENNPRLARLLAKEQNRLTKAITKIFESAKNNGWIRADIPTAAAAVFIQAYTLGKIVDDLVATPVDSSDWDSLIGFFVERTLLKD